MTKAIEMSENINPQVFEFCSMSMKKQERGSDFINMSIEIYKKMEKNQRIFRNYIVDMKIENLRKNFVTWLFNIAPRLEVSKHTVFNSISMMDNLFSKMDTDDISDSKKFQLFAVVCFFLSFKFFEKKKMKIEFVRNSLLHGKWSHDDIRHSEIHVLEKLNYQIDFINFYSFFQFFEQTIRSYFDKPTVAQIMYISKIIMQKAIKLHELQFNLLPLQQVILILNTTFLVIQQLTQFEIENHSSFFVNLTNLTSNQQISDFEKHSSCLINNLSLSEELFEKFSNLN